MVSSNTGELIVSVSGTLKTWVKNTVKKYVDKAVEEGTGLEKLTQNAKKSVKQTNTLITKHGRLGR